MPSTLTATFDTRRAADMTVERLVQEFRLERTDIFVTTEGDENSAGTKSDGGDGASAAPTPVGRDDAALTGKIIVSVELQDNDAADAVRTAFSDFAGA